MDESRKPPASVPRAVMTEVVVAANTRIGRYRWVICGLLFFATTINYVDRQVLGILSKDLQHALGWNELQYGNIVAAFNAAYALGLLFAGRMMDRFGTRVGYSLALSIWSLAAMAHALASSAFGFGVARAALGLGEAGNFPAAIKTIAEWFPKKERALATGIFNGGSNIGAIVAPLTVPWIAINYGWQWAFILTGAIGLLWLAFWIPIYARPEVHPRVTREELAHIQSDPQDPAAKIPWVRLIPYRQTSAFAIGKCLTDPIWWFYLYWIPPFLRDKHGLDLTTIGPPLIAIYVIADVGSIGGGWLSSFFIKQGWTVNRARKTAMLVCAVMVTPIVLVSQVKSLWIAVALVGLAAAAHQGWSANIFTLASDMFPRRAVGSVVGIGGMAGAFSGATMAVIVGYILQVTGGNYRIPFYMAGVAYLVALLVIHLLVPNVEPLGEVDEAAPKAFSVGSLVGFGFMGSIFGSFGGWCIGILSRASGPHLLEYMALGLLIGAAIGIVCGTIICQNAAKTKR
jgi:ACS family hexuronate transporter-like MFS transporter